MQAHLWDGETHWTAPRRQIVRSHHVSQQTASGLSIEWRLGCNSHREAPPPLIHHRTNELHDVRCNIAPNSTVHRVAPRCDGKDSHGRSSSLPMTSPLS